MPRGKRLGRPTGSIGEATRRRLLMIAMKHIGEYGYAGATFNNIAEEAGLTSGAVYYYFRSKKDLVVAVIAMLPPSCWSGSNGPRRERTPYRAS